MQITALGQVRKSDKVISEAPVEDSEIQGIYSSMNFNSSKVTDETAVTMTQIYRILARFKLNRNEIKAYLLLARAGPQKAQRISESIDVERTEVYKVLRTLESYGLINKTLDKPMKFKAKPFEMVLEGLIREKRKHIHQLEEQKSKILDVWNALPKISDEESSEGIQVLEGKRQILVKIDEMLSSCTRVFNVNVRDSELIWLYNSMFFEDANKLGRNRELDLRLLTNFSNISEYVFEKVESCVDHAFMKRACDPSFILNDNKELLIIMREGDKGPTAMHTNYPALISAFKALFSFMWFESSQITYNYRSQTK
jgi:HTH-type transcriptional regulator, sugar sensing transcriptional regulator